MLDKYLTSCLESIKDQAFEDFECLVVDDAGLDSTKEIVGGFMAEDSRFKYLRPPENLGLALARNYGFRKSRGQYVRFVDADDMLDEHCLSIEVEHLEKNRGVHVTYGHLKNVSEDGTPKEEYVGEGGEKWPPATFNWRQQMAHLNQLPSCTMMRRQAFERSGGYRKRHWRAEDAAFWCRISSLGQRIQKCTERPTYLHRMREDSKGAMEWKEMGGEGDWTAWYPWRICGSRREALHLWGQINGRVLPAPELVPFGAQGLPPKERKSWFVHDYSYPNVSVVITVGPGHEDYVIDAVESVLAQSYPDWEMVVVNDTGKEWANDFRSPLAGAPYATLVQTEDGPRGAAFARNFGASFTTAPLIAWLDADDYWLPDFLKETVAEYEVNEGIIATGWLKNDGDRSEMHYEQPKPVECGKVLHKMNHAGTSILVPRIVHEKIVEAQGGWDESIPGMEDWDYQIAAQVYAEACSFIVAKPLFVYRFLTSTKRETDYAKIDDITKYVYKKYHAWYTGEKQVACGCGSRRKAPAAPKSTLSSSGNFQAKAAPPSSKVTEPSGAMVMLEYVGPREESFTIRGRVTGTRYKFGGPHHRQKMVYAEDADVLLGSQLVSGPEYIQIERLANGSAPGIGVEAFTGNAVGPGVSEPQMPEIAAGD